MLSSIIVEAALSPSQSFFVSLLSRYMHMKTMTSQSILSLTKKKRWGQSQLAALPVQNSQNNKSRDSRSPSTAISLLQRIHQWKMRLSIAPSAIRRCLMPVFLQLLPMSPMALELAHVSVLITWRARPWPWSMAKWWNTPPISGAAVTLGMLGSTLTARLAASGASSPGVM